MRNIINEMKKATDGMAVVNDMMQNCIDADKQLQELSAHRLDMISYEKATAIDIHRIADLQAAQTMMCQQMMTIMSSMMVVLTKQLEYEMQSQQSVEKEEDDTWE